MVIDTVVGVVAGLVVLGILLGGHIVPNNPGVLQLAAVIVTNTVYETFLVFLLAYGLVELPRSVWNSSDYDYYLTLTQMKATSAYKSINAYRTEIQEQNTKVMFFKDMVRHTCTHSWPSAPFHYSSG